VEHLKLPNSVISQIDLARLLRELNNLEDFFAGAKLRTSGTAMQLPKLSRQMDQLARDNKANLLDEADRMRLNQALKSIYEQAPKLHMSFASEPSARAFEQVLVWLRENVHQHALVQIGLQPAIAAGIVMRTPNRIFDMSLRARLEDQKTYLARLIKGAVDGR
jgi:F0F1-type ATP synthase delta subunit